MNPARSPRFQSDAERCNIAVISCGGFPNGRFGALHPITIESQTTDDARRIVLSSLTCPRERLVETLPRMAKRVVLAAAFLLGGLLLLLRRFLLLCLGPGLLGGFLFLLRLGLGRARRLFHRHRWHRRGRGRRREHRFHEPRSRPTAVRYVRLLKHRIFSYAGRCRGVVGGL